MKALAKYVRKNPYNEALETAGMRFAVRMTNDPIPEGFSPGSHAWKVTLRYRGRQMTVPFYTGSMCGEVTAADVLHCLISDASSADNTFEDWCADFGYDSDSRKAERTYKACQRIAVKLNKLLGSDLEKFAAIVADYWECSSSRLLIYTLRAESGSGLFTRLD